LVAPEANQDVDGFLRGPHSKCHSRHGDAPLDCAKPERISIGFVGTLVEKEVGEALSKDPVLDWSGSVDGVPGDRSRGSKRRR
jgi:hypothetical protein